ncbi:MAG: Holliday junction branch migration protein RuvA [Clostridia bacterium]|nr:Holliday junction branch migration protein RuvA [Clostridia bacterium]
MIYSLKGTLVTADVHFAVIEVGGIGFKCFCSTRTLAQLPQAGKEVFLLTYMNVREDAIELYGFCDKTELDCYKLLIDVKGIGPKAAMSILSTLTPDRLALAVASKDFKAIQAAPGIGRKGAEMVILELKDKLGALDIESGEIVEEVADVSVSASKKDAIDALVSLGYSQSDAAKAIAKAGKGLSTEDLIKYALTHLGI